MRTEQEYKNLEEAKDATIAQQAEEIATYRAEVATLKEQLAAAQKDARRYRWLSSNSKHIKWIPSNYNKDVVSGFSAFSTGYLGFGFEEAIDAAIAAQEVKS